MKVSLNWLQDYITLPADLSVGDLTEKLTMAGLEVEEIIHLGEGFDKILVAEVREVIKHPNADSSSLCKVSTGNGDLSIVCGAPNVRAGQKVPLAPVGVTLPNDLKIKRSKIRGETSEGMICSEAELGLEEESEGIMVLPPDFSLGEPLSKALGLRDTVLDLSITPNRSDCLGHFGVAREMGAILNLPLKSPEIRLSKTQKDDSLEVDILDREGCPAYLGRVVREVTPVASPLFIQNRLRAVGLRPINQVVDATNYVSLELGQPTHAFDFRFIQDGKIVVRRAHPQEGITTLDGKSRVLKEEDLLICDAQGPVALAGVMGGENSEIRPDTKNLILECAYFEPRTIRLTSRRLGILSDSSYRFERGVDPCGQAFAMDRLTYLIDLWTQEGGKPAPKIFEVVSERGKLFTPHAFSLPLPFLNQRLGISLPSKQVVQNLESLGITCSPSKEKDELKVEIPTFRVDLDRPIDLVEEIARLYGYDQIPTTLPKTHLEPLHPQKKLELKKQISEVLVGYGFYEAINYTFSSKEDSVRLGLSDKGGPELMNPLAEDQALLRSMLLPGLLRNTAYNLNRGNSEIRLFECSKVFTSENGVFGEQAAPGAPMERLALGGILCGNRFEEVWCQERFPLDFFDLKGILEDIFSLFPGRVIDFVPLEGSKRDYPFLHSGRSVELQMGNKASASPPEAQRVMGWMGVIHPQVLARFDIKEGVFGFEMDFEALLAPETQPVIPFKTLPPYPEVRRDLAIVVSEEIPAKLIYDLIFSIKSKIIDRVVLFDVYRGEQVPKGKRSLAYAIHYLSRDRTLTSEEVDRLHNKVLERLTSELGAEVRS